MQHIQSLFLNPARFFQNHPPENFRRSVLIAAVALGIAGAILALFTYLNLDAIRANYAGTYSATVLPAAYDRLAFPIVWALVIAINSLFRYIAARIFGDGAEFGTIAHISLHAAAPPVIAGFLIGIWSALFPFGPAEAFGRGLVAVMLFSLSFVYEAWICVAGLREFLKQNTGRAILTWLAPLAGWCGCVAVPIAVLYIALQF